MFFQTLPNKISLALILKRKSCICCQKLCRDYFRMHMECAVLKSFWGCRELFRKSSCNIHFPIEEKFNLNRFISTLYKTKFPSFVSLRSTPSPWEKAFKPFRQATLATFPFRDGFRFGKAPMKGELSRSDWGVIISVR